MLHYGRMTGRKSSKKAKAKKAAMPPAAKRPAKEAVTAAIEAAPAAAPQPSYRAAAFFALGLMLIAGLLFALVRETRPKLPSAGAEPFSDDPAFATLAKSGQFRDWIVEWRKVDPYVSPTEFSLRSSGVVVPVRPGEEIVPATLLPPLAERYVWSPDKTRFVDYLSAYGEPDSAVTAYDRLGDRKVETLAFCGTPCGFDSAFWIDNDRVVVFGSEESVHEDGRPLCITSGDGVKRCYRRLTVTLYDFARDEKRTYVSDDHQLSSNPFDVKSRDRWIRGLTGSERETLGVMPTGETTILQGVIVEYVADARVLAISGGNSPRFAVLAPTAIVRDEDGQLVGHGYLRKGQEIEANAVAGSDGTLIVLGVRVYHSPAISLDRPRDGADVDATFVVSGRALVFEGTVRIRVKNVRTGRTLVDDFTTAAAADSGLLAPFAYDATLPASRVRTGDSLTLEVFQESAESGEETDMVTLNLIYRP